MKFFFSYLKSRRMSIGLFFLFEIIHLVVAVLCRLPLAAVLYPMALCMAVGLILLIRDFCKVFHRHRALCVIQSMTDAMILPLPEAEGILAEDYQRIIRLLCREQSRCVNEMNVRYQDMVEYYTVWAHQVKTPIASMRLNLQNEDSALVRQLSSDLTRIEQYVDMVLTFLRLDSGSTDYVIREQELDMLLGALASGDRAARNRLAEGHLARVVELAKEYAGRGVLMADLVQEGNMALLMAMESFDGGDFGVHITREICSAMEAVLAEQTGQADTGSYLAAQANAIMKATEELVEELGREATLAEVAKKMNLSEDMTKDIMKISMDALSVVEANGTGESFGEEKE